MGEQHNSIDSVEEGDWLADAEVRCLMGTEVEAPSPPHV